MNSFICVFVYVYRALQNSLVYALSVISVFVSYTYVCYVLVYFVLYVYNCMHTRTINKISCILYLVPKTVYALTLKVLATTMALSNYYTLGDCVQISRGQWEGRGDVGSARYDHKGFKLQ